jgi:fructose-1,6-bisphosphatase/inositol monophosphatase family enzyme
VSSPLFTGISSKSSQIHESAKGVARINLLERNTLPCKPPLKLAANGQRRLDRRLAVSASEAFTLRRVLARSVAAVGERLIRGNKGTWEFDSLDRSHVSSRNDLEGTAFIVRYVPEFLAREELPFVISFENEELPLVPAARNGQRLLRLVIDPVDGSKAFDNHMCHSDVPIPEPSSAVSVAAVCPFGHELVASAVYCFDLSEVFSSCLLNPGSGATAEYVAYRNETLLAPVQDLLTAMPNIGAKRRVLNGNYNSRALAKLAELDLALMDRGLNSTFGGLTGSSATDIVNVTRGSFAACIDVRAMCARKGSVPYWYDIAGAVGVARGRGLRVLVMTAGGAPLLGGDHEIYTPVSFVVARPDVFETVTGVLREKFGMGVPAAT